MIQQRKSRIAEQIEERIVSSGAEQVKFIRPIANKDASGLVAAVYEQMTKDFQLLTPITVHSIIPQLLGGVWCVVRETLIAGKVPRLQKEVVATCVSQANQCGFCVDAHLMNLQGGDERRAAHAIEASRFDEIEDRTLRGLAVWARQTRSPRDIPGQVPPFDQESAPEIIGTAVAFHYINRIVAVFLGKSPIELPRALAWAKVILKEVGIRTLAKRLVHTSARPGESLRLLPEASLPTDVAWARSNPFVAGAYGRLAGAMDSLGPLFIPEPVRALVLERVLRWQGETMGISRGWVEEEIGALDESIRPAARLALLTAIAPFQIDSRIIETFRTHSPTDEALLATVSWSAFAAARRIGAWLDPYKHLAEAT